MFYAAHLPRNFANEFTVKAFDTRKERDEFCEEVNSDVNQRALPLNRDEARKWARYNGNAITESFASVDDKARQALGLD
jgi:hypothetical protein